MSLEDRVAKLEAKFKNLDADIKKRNLSKRVEKLEKVVHKKPHPGKNK